MAAIAAFGRLRHKRSFWVVPDSVVSFNIVELARVPDSAVNSNVVELARVPDSVVSFNAVELARVPDSVVNCRKSRDFHYRREFSFGTQH